MAWSCVHAARFTALRILLVGKDFSVFSKRRNAIDRPNKYICKQRKAINRPWKYIMRNLILRAGVRSVCFPQRGDRGGAGGETGGAEN